MKSVLLRFTHLICLLALVVSANASAAGKVGIAMPEKTIARWIADGNNMVEQFHAAGYETILQYANDDLPTQLAQLENMILNDVDVLIIAAIDGTTLSGVLSQAAERDIKIIAYDRLIRGSANVDYYATFDNFQVGVIQGSYIENALGLKSGKGPYNIELFGGSPDDNNAYFFYNGAMSVLQPYIDSGKLVVKSGQMGMDKVSTLRWDGATAQSRMDNLLSAYYTDARVDAVLAPNDGLAIGVISSLKGLGYGSKGTPMPVITGQDAEIQSIKAIIAGDQSSTVFKDTRELAKVTVSMVQALMENGTPQINDTKTYDNGVKVVPSYLLKPVSVDASNWKSVLIDSGYYTMDQIK
ncbi:multiple monosaccharide ABC transporter substrate-binding protein [Gynuella sp.]|uniref:multiple monosaccharide ABC transporter substrate-binding protein n=1 Tax=Gynuella sp. TaxID=2969146 RepID=UPI003D0EC138